MPSWLVCVSIPHEQNVCQWILQSTNISARHDAVRSRDTRVAGKVSTSRARRRERLAWGMGEGRLAAMTNEPIRAFVEAISRSIREHLLASGGCERSLDGRTLRRVERMIRVERALQHPQRVCVGVARIGIPRSCVVEAGGARRLVAVVLGASAQRSKSRTVSRTPCGVTPDQPQQRDDAGMQSSPARKPRKWSAADDSCARSNEKCAARVAHHPARYPIEIEVRVTAGPSSAQSASDICSPSKNGLNPRTRFSRKRASRRSGLDRRRPSSVPPSGPAGCRYRLGQLERRVAGPPDAATNASRASCFPRRSTT